MKIQGMTFWQWISWRLPRPLVYWAAIRLGVHATTATVEYARTEVPALTFIEAVKRWER